MIAQKEMSAEEFLAFAEQHPDKRFDFIDGEVVEVSPKPLHGRIQSLFVGAFLAYNARNPVGVVYTETLHVLSGEKFIPDVCINVASDADYLTTPPRVAVEIRSDSQSRASQQRKARAYIQHGANMVILTFPHEQVEIYLPGHDPLVLTAEGVIDGGDVLPGFTLPVRDVLG
ncbi:MAG: Uma2 family endonuclease [Anaerolineae bacterium]|nr:Uma2 family endonuclease [Anaerolineae bacterium]